MRTIEIDGEFFDTPLQIARGAKAAAIKENRLSTASAVVKVIKELGDTWASEIVIKAIIDACRVKEALIETQPIQPDNAEGGIVHMPSNPIEIILPRSFNDLR